MRMTKMYHTNVSRSFAAVRERYNTLDFPCRKIVCQGALPLWNPSHARRNRRANVQTARPVSAHFKGGSASSGHPAYFLRLYICKTHFASAIYSLENNNLLQLPSYLGMSPPLEWTSPSMDLIVVVLPAPFRPIKPTIRPESKLKVISDRMKEG